MRRRKLGAFLAIVLGPPLRAIGFIGGHLYRLLFSGADKRLAREHEVKLAEDIGVYLPFLFNEMGGRIVPNALDVEFPPPFDYATVTVEMPHILLRFTRGRDHLSVQVSKMFPNRWHELSTILTTLEVPGVQRGSIGGLSQVAQLLRSNMNEIAKAFSEDEYQNLRTRLDRVYAHDRAVTKQLETELNRVLRNQ